MTIASARLELLESVARNPQGRPLAAVSAELPPGVRIVVVREGDLNRDGNDRREREADA